MNEFPPNLNLHHEQEIDPIREKCSTEIYHPNKEERETEWEKIKQEVLEIEQINFGEKGFPEELLIKDFNNPDNTVILIRDKESEKIVGFTYAEPSIDEDNPQNPTNTALISDTVIHPDYQHHRLVIDLMKQLEAELKRKGFNFMERYSAYESGYADKIARAYEGRIVEQSEPEEEESDYGFKRVYFKIKL